MWENFTEILQLLIKLYIGLICQKRTEARLNTFIPVQTLDDTILTKHTPIIISEKVLLKNNQQTVKERKQDCYYVDHNKLETL